MAVVRPVVVAGALAAGCGRLAFSEQTMECEPRFADRDGDGFGDPGDITTSCDPDPVYVTNADDCDDRDRRRNPNARDICGSERDCQVVTEGACPVDCQLERRPIADDAHSYLFCTTAVSWPVARTRCDDLGFYLVEIEDAAENMWLRQRADQLLGPSEFVQLGGTDQAVEGEWRWSRGPLFWSMTTGAVPYAPWSPSEPNNSNNMTEHCLEMYGGAGDWNDVPCAVPHVFVCEAD